MSTLIRTCLLLCLLSVRSARSAFTRSAVLLTPRISPSQSSKRQRQRSSSRICTKNRSLDAREGTYLAAFPSKESNEQAITDKKNFQSGFLVLCSVPLAWGTFEPAVRYVYEVAPQIPTLVFSVAYYAVAAAGLLALIVYEKLNARHSVQETVDKTTAGEIPPQTTTQSSLCGGIELGTYLFLGNAFQVFGLRTTPSDRAAFLLQLTTIFVPFTQAILSGSMTVISTRVWVASVTALAGVAIISLDGTDDSLASTAQVTSQGLSLLRFSAGDWLIVGAAVLYTFHCIRLELYAKTTSAAQLAFTKAVTEMSLSLVAALSLVVGSFVLPRDTSSDSIMALCTSSGEAIKSFVTGFGGVVQGENSAGLLSAYVATTWIGLVTVAYTIYAQSYGQRYVKPETANLIYTIQPLYTSLFAWLLLGETLGPLGYGGGMVVLLAVLLVATEEKPAT